MKKSITLFTKLKEFSNYKRIINDCKNELNIRFNIRIDSANRLYTVLNIPEELVGEAYSLKKSDIDRISENYVKQYSKELSEFLNTKGLQEIFDFYEIKKVDKYSYLLVYGFSLFNSTKYYNTLYYVIAPSLIALIIGGLILLV